ncbi:hypothetical protein CKM354_000862700 [Cercospora kikuchii]|uniref:Pinin/SDK/MemA protein domain-containing protein n=1 Tax=Cercospora kikuchii TaxID=84275 RepID=A0A9P3CLL8_9PEZI|nr:uncharacterized protein CKM354_000862700 [Cercospora kikuchii]GIZ45462.1 hypothetical protein CKM354_000862700 [Cercospora kikuchii]
MGTTRLTAWSSVASAIALPEPEDLAEPGDNSLKRRQFEDVDTESSSKRQRTSPGKTPPKAKAREEVVSSAARPRSVTPVESKNGEGKEQKPAEDSKDARRRGSAKGADEKQRSKRLFGALLGNLNRPSDRTSKRRAEIEQRKKAELQKQDDERLEDRQKRLERLAVQRKKEQINVDERDMHVRHKNMLSKANFLQTRAEPKLYYRPWDLLPDEEDLVEQQIKDAQAQIDRELVEWEEEKQKRLDGIHESAAPRDTNKIPSKADTSTANDDEPGNVDTLEAKHNGKTNSPIQHDADGDVTGIEEVEKTTNKTNDSVRASPQLAASAENERQDGKLETEIPEQSGAEHQIQDEQNDKPDNAETQDGKEKPPTQDDAKEDKEDLDDDGDHVVEGDEDNVIY